MGDLAIAAVALDDDDPAADRLDERGVVGRGVRGGVGAPQHAGAEGLWGLDGNQ